MSNIFIKYNDNISIMHFSNYGCQDLKNTVQEGETQTSKTILQLAVTELEKINLKCSAKKKNEKHNSKSTLCNKSPRSYRDIYTRQEFLRSTSPLNHRISRHHSPNKNDVNFELNKDPISLSQLSRFTIKKIHIKPVNISKENNNMGLRLSSSPYPNLSRDPSPEQTELKYVYEDENVETPKPNYYSVIDNEQCQKDEINTLITQMKCTDWNVALAALKHIAHISENISVDTIYPFMPEINQRLIHLMQSPRSHVCRTSCQIAGHLFQSVGDTRRPEFDDIVDLLLCRTADANRFIKIDANEALTNMVSCISPYHSVRSICNKGTKHKNDLVRIASARLFVRIITVCTPNIILGLGGNEFTRKRILSNMFNFINDKNIQVRHYGEELRKMLCQHPNYNFYIKECMDTKYKPGRTCIK